MGKQRSVYGAMLEPEEAARRLKGTGARMTAQRRAVLEILRDNRTHPTADEIVRQVEEKLGCVAPATIYNTLEVLERLGFVRRIDGLEQRAHYDPDTSPHQHAICTRCKRVWDVESVALPSDLPEGFIVHETIIQGTCRACTPPGNHLQA